LYKHNNKVIINIAGIRKFALPNTNIHITETTTPITAGVCFLFESHCSKNTVKNNAVKAKSIPSLLKLISVPTNAPNTDPTIQ